MKCWDARARVVCWWWLFVNVRVGTYRLGWVCDENETAGERVVFVFAGTLGWERRTVYMCST